MQPWCSYIYIVFVFINIANFVFVLITIVNFVFVLLNIVFVLINIVFIGTSLIFLAPPWEFSSLGFTTLLLSGERPPRTLNFDPNDLHCYKESCTWMRKLLGHNCCLFKSFEGLYDFSFCKITRLKQTMPHHTLYLSIWYKAEPYSQTVNCSLVTKRMCVVWKFSTYDKIFKFPFFATVLHKKIIWEKYSTSHQTIILGV